MFFTSWLRRGRAAADRPSSRRPARLRLEQLEDRLVPSAGQLDPTFGAGGAVTTDIQGPTENGADALVVNQADGKVLVAGDSGSSQAGQRLDLVRYNTDGSLDQKFGNRGEVVFQFLTSPFGDEEAIGALAIDPAGRIVVAGRADGFFGPNYVALARFFPDGSLDSSFGQDGVALLPANFADSAQGLAFDSSGRIVLAATNHSPAGDHIEVLRVNCDGSLDTSFGNGGQAIAGSGDAAGIALDAGGRIIVGGNTAGSFAVMRLNCDGSPDTSFGTGGVGTLHVGPSGFSSDLAAGMAVDPCGAIVVVGTVNNFSTEGVGVARFDSAGRPDATFGSGGGTTIGFGPFLGFDFDTAAGVAVDPACRVVVAGTTDSFAGISDQFAVARLNCDGTLDTSFGSGGKAVINFIPRKDFVADAAGVVVDPAGRVVVAGGASGQDNGTGADIAVARLTGAGALDAAWGQGGRVTTDVLGPSDDTAVSLSAAGPGGKIVVVGTSSGPELSLARYNPDGSLDTGFNGDGMVRFNSSSPLFFYPSAVTVDGSGRTLVAGSGSPLNLSTFFVLRLNPDGSPDATFGHGGLATVVFGSGANFDRASGIAVDAGGRIVLAGTASSNPEPSTGPDFALARLNPDGSLDPTFGTGGETTVSFGTGFTFDSASGLAIDPAGRIIVAGTTDNNSDLAVTRLDANGHLDGSFGVGGKTTVAFPAGSLTVAGVALDPQSRIVVAGTTGPAFVVTRLDANGNLDGSFGQGGEATVGFAGATAVAAGLAIDPLGRIAVAGTASNSTTVNIAVALLQPSGLPDVDFGINGEVTTNLGNTSSAAGVTFDSAGRLLVAGTMAPGVNRTSDFALVRYLGHDPVIEAGSPNFNADLQSAITALDTGSPAGTPRVVVHVASQAQMAAVLSAVAGLRVNPAGPEIEVLLDIDPGTYTLGAVSVPAGLKLIIDGNGGAGGARVLSGSSSSALTVVSGDVVVRDGVVLTAAGSAPTILIQGGQVVVQDSTIDADGPGALIRLTGPSDVPAFGDTFEVNGTPLSDNFQIEDRIDHSLDGLGGGTVFWVPENVFVTAMSGSVQRGVNVVPAGGTVNVQDGVKGSYSVGSEPLTIAYQSGQSITQQADSLDATKLSLTVWDFGNNDSVKFVAGTNPGEVQVNIDNLPRGTFLPTGRLIAHAQGQGDDVQVDGGLTLSAWLYGDGSNDRLRGGGGNDVLIGNGWGDLLAGGSGRDLLIGTGPTGCPAPPGRTSSSPARRSSTTTRRRWRRSWRSGPRPTAWPPASPT
jgi:uncharacterized delta-60 repeat protein